MGKAGRQCLDRLLGRARADFQPDFLLMNGENAAGGFGLTKKLYDKFTDSMGFDAVTMGNHWHDKREIYDFLPRAERLVIPGNMSNVDRDELGLKIITAKNGERVAVINLIGKAFMKGENRCPFKTADRLLSFVPESVKIRVVDVHAEATSEKQALARYLAGRISLLYGTHSHVPTADERIISVAAGNTGFTTDIGMTGGYGSVIGIRTEAAILRMLTGEKKRFEPASDDPWFCFIIVDVDTVSGSCLKIQRYRWELSDPVLETGTAASRGAAKDDD
jgi:metallophosphoesterase (TIGR00282 family)